MKELHIAPMLDVSTREFRQLLRILSKRAILWTEMVVDETLAFTASPDDHLAFELETQPLICQLGGNNSEWTAAATKMVQDYGYQEVNFNMDCPSNRVSGKREFGAILLKKLDTAVACLNAMRQSTTKATSKKIPISVKMRIGVDDWDDLEYAASVVRRLEPVCQRFYLHARKCVLGGLLSPAQNRIVPPLNYPRVYELCNMFPHCDFWINGGIPGLASAKHICYGTVEADSDLMAPQHEHTVPCMLCKSSNGSCIAPPSPAPLNLKGCMIGRAAMDNPGMFWDVDRYFYGHASNPCRNRRQVLEQYCLYLERVYPRRCCDVESKHVTNKIVPNQERDFDGPYCIVCCDMYAKNDPPMELPQHQKGTIKISSRVIDRSFKPILGIFFGLPQSKTFRRLCDKLSRDYSIRNCGPGFILRKAWNDMPTALLNQDFCRTENLLHLDVHVAPRTQGGCVPQDEQSRAVEKSYRDCHPANLLDSPPSREE